jgi:hypothetical protein
VQDCGLIIDLTSAESQSGLFVIDCKTLRADTKRTITSYREAATGKVMLAFFDPNDIGLEIDVNLGHLQTDSASGQVGWLVFGWIAAARRQVLGALIMGISYSLFEEKVMDPITGRMLNADMEFYRLAGLGDIPELVVHMMTGKGYDEKGVIGLGEPPVISPGAAIATAVANAIDVTAPFLPLTPDRILKALSQKVGA